MARRYLLPSLLLGLLSSPACSDGDEVTPTPPVNNAPAVTSLELLPSSQVLPGDLVSIAVTVEDPEGDDVSLSWSALEGDFSSPFSTQTTFLVPDRLGILSLTLSMTDALGATSSFSTALRVGYVITPDADDDGYTWEGGDCDDLDASVSPSAQEAVDGRDNDCDGLIDEGSLVSDDDADLWSELDGDCDDTNPAVYPTHPEIADGPNQGIDNDCDGVVDEDTEYFDDDGDGVSELEGDCLDSSAAVYPAAAEIADELDNDCDGLTDEDTVRSDDDEDGTSELEGDCDDTRAAVSPLATEVLDSLDNDCDGLIDEESPESDDDSDGFSELSGDCDDLDPLSYPAAQELSDDRDNDCDLIVDEGTVRYDDDSDGYSEVLGDCNDQDPLVFPDAPELEDGIDNDCNGLLDDGTVAYDADGDGFSVLDGDCDDFNQMTYPTAVEMPDTLDNDCDGTVDENTFRSDDDQDGFSELAGDCDDASVEVYPGALEVDDGRDNNCDGVGDPNTPPIAVAADVADGTVCDELLLDASESTDPDGDAIVRVYWYVLEKPEGSVMTDAWILDQSAVQTSVTADKPGSYRIGLMVSDGVSSSEPAIVAFSLESRGANSDPVAEAGDDQEKSQKITCALAGGTWVCPSCPPWTVTLDAGQSTDAELDRLFYSWSVSSNNASGYTLTQASQRTATLQIPAPPTEYGRTNTYTLFLKLEVRDCEDEKDVDSVMVTYSCTGL